MNINVERFPGQLYQFVELHILKARIFPTNWCSSQWHLCECTCGIRFYPVAVKYVTLLVTAKSFVSRCTKCKLRRNLGFSVFPSIISFGGHAIKNATRIPTFARLRFLRDGEKNRTENDPRISKRIAVESGTFVEGRMEGSKHCFSLASGGRHS